VRGSDAGPKTALDLVNEELARLVRGGLATASVATELEGRRRAPRPKPECDRYRGPDARCWLPGEEVNGQPDLECCYACPALAELLHDPVVAVREQTLLLVSQLRERTRVLRELAYRDELTDLHNRRFLDEVLPGVLARSVRLEREVWLMMADLDGLKRINDTWGHRAGDAALLEVANLLRAVVRSSDYVFRVGGDEFLVLLTDADVDVAVRVVTRLELALDERNRTQPGALAPISLSFGLARCRSAAELDDALAEADARMYRSKGAGRAG